LPDPDFNTFAPVVLPLTGLLRALFGDDTIEISLQDISYLADFMHNPF